MEYITLSEAARRIGTTRVLLRRRVSRAQLATYRNPLDDRTRLVKVADLDALRQPTPIKLASRPTGEAGA